MLSTLLRLPHISETSAHFWDFRTFLRLPHISETFVHFWAFCMFYEILFRELLALFFSNFSFHCFFSIFHTVFFYFSHGSQVNCTNRTSLLYSVDRTQTWVNFYYYTMNEWMNEWNISGSLRIWHESPIPGGLPGWKLNSTFKENLRVAILGGGAPWFEPLPPDKYNRYVLLLLTMQCLTRL